MIKVGQIYRLNEYCGCLVITKKYSNGIYQAIFNSGRAEVYDSDFLKVFDLIAEYETWQEAVNSKEFKEE